MSLPPDGSSPAQSDSRKVLDAAQIEGALLKMAKAIAQGKKDSPFAVVGIRSGGEALAHRLIAKLAPLLQGTQDEIPLGMVDISLYRDDGFGPNEWPSVGVTELPFSPRAYTVILVDDVLFTGRTVRAALDVILDYGRPKAVRLAVLVDRGLRELPIGPDVVGHKEKTESSDHVVVALAATPDASDRVWIEARTTVGDAS